MNLSQEEIQSFAQALDASGDSAKSSSTKQVKGYDFTHPDKLSKVHLKVLQCVMSSLERSWGSTLSAGLRSEVTVSLNSLEQVSFGALAESLPDVGLLSTLSLGTLPGEGYIHLPAGLALSAVDRMTGGVGKIYGELRGLSEVECRIIKRLLDRLASDFNTAFKVLAEVKLSSSQCYSSAEEIEVNREEMLLVAGFVWNIASTQHNVVLAIPINALYIVRDMLTMEQWMRGKSGESQPAVNLTSTPLLDSVMLETAVELGRARVSMQDVIEIGVGDVIKLNRAVDDPLAIQIQGKVKFHGRPGLAGNQIAVQITEQAEESAIQDESTSELCLEEK